MKTVIFDMDGVVVDSEPLNDRHQIVLFSEMGIDLAEKPHIGSLRGMNSKSMWTLLKSEYGLNPDVGELIDHGRKSYMTFLENLTDIPIVPGVRELIESLSGLEYELGLASSANPRRIDLFLERLNLNDKFNAVVSGDDVERGKPDPEAFLLAASKLGASPRRCVVIEDSTSGVKAAKAAGMFCIGFCGLEHNDEDLSESDILVKDFYQLAEYVKRGRNIKNFIS